MFLQVSIWTFPLSPALVPVKHTRFSRVWEVASWSQKLVCGYSFHKKVRSIVRGGFTGGSMVKNPPASAGDVRDSGSIPALGRSPGGGHGNPLQYSCLGILMDRGGWQAIVHRVTKSWIRLRTKQQLLEGYWLSYLYLVKMEVSGRNKL